MPPNGPFLIKNIQLLPVWQTDKTVNLTRFYQRKGQLSIIKWVDHLGQFNPKGSGWTKQHNDVCRDKMDAKMQPSAPLLAQEGTVDFTLTQTVKKEQKWS